LPSESNHDGIHSSDTNYMISIKWFPGTSMYRALALAANLGIDHIRKLFRVAGNASDPFDQMMSLLFQEFTNMDSQ
jgi:hypothetical protein